MNESQAKELAEIMALTKQVAESVLKANQVGTSRKPYYTEKWASRVAEILELVYTTGEPRLIPEGDFTASTITNQWYQGKDYLVRFMDPDKKYAEMLVAIGAEYQKKRGLVIAPRRRRGILAAVKIQPWKGKFEEFIETAAELQKFERIGVGLTQEDFDYVRDTLTPLSDMFVWHVDLLHDHLKVVRVSQGYEPKPS